MPCIIIGHPDHANHLEVLVLDIVVARGTRNQLSIIIYQVEAVERITRSTRGSGRDMYLIIMVVGGGGECHTMCYKTMSSKRFGHQRRRAISDFP